MGTHVTVIGAMEAELEGLRDLPVGDPARDGCVVYHAGVGKVNAALAVAGAAQRGTRCVIVVGTAGALVPALRIGDVVVIDHAVQHDVDASPVGFPRGTIPFEQESAWDADEPLVRIAKRAADDLGFPAVVGSICSGERFIADDAERAWLRDHFHGACIDMETGAIAQACAKLSIPWVGIRIISDGANREAAADFAASLALASDHIACIIPKIIALQAFG